MRKIEEQMAQAVDQGRNWTSGNTQVQAMHGGRVEVRLHGNLIAQRNDRFSPLRFTLAGWNTPTTRSRLNALGAGVYTRKGQAYVPGGVAIADDQWFGS